MRTGSGTADGRSALLPEGVGPADGRRIAGAVEARDGSLGDLAIGRRAVVVDLHRRAGHRVFVILGNVGEMTAVGAPQFLARHDVAVRLGAFELAALLRQE